MSIALQSNGGDKIRRPRFIHGMPCISIYDSSEPKAFARDRRLEPDMDSCSSSSIGRNSVLSDGSSNGDDSADDEVQSSFRGPLDTMDELEEVLPIIFGRCHSPFGGTDVDLLFQQVVNFHLNFFGKI